jgi:hypothetical protein
MYFFLGEIRESPEVHHKPVKFHPEGCRNPLKQCKRISIIPQFLTFLTLFFFIFVFWKFDQKENNPIPRTWKKVANSPKCRNLFWSKSLPPWLIFGKKLSNKKHSNAHFLTGGK